MSDFTIEQLEALKEGTTPGPWLITPHQNPVGIEATRWYGIPMERANADLAEAAPSLVDALIAEKRAHQKLRAEIEELRTECKTIVDDNGKGHESYEPNDVAALIEECHYNALTRILGTDNE